MSTQNQPTEYVQAFDGNPDGGQLGKNASSKLGFYGVTPVAQRAYSSEVHLSSDLSTSTEFNQAHLVALNEVQKTLVALGIYATA